MNIAFWGVYESDYPRNKVFIDELQKKNTADVHILHIPLFEKNRDKSGSYLSFSNLLITGIKLLFAYIRLSVLYIENRKKIDVWVCGYIGQSDVIVLGILKKLFADSTPILFNSLLSVYDTLVLDRDKFKENSIPGRILYHIDRIAFKYADKIIIDTRQHKKFIEEIFGVSEEKICVIPAVADSMFFDYLAELPPAEKIPFKVQLVGKFIPLYGLEYIIDAAEILKGEDIIFEFIGGGQLEKWFQMEIRKRNLSNIDLKGWALYHELPKEMATAHLSLGIFDPGSKSQRVIPNKVFQSLAMGKIILTADSPAIREIPECESILFLVPPGSGQAIAEKILAIRNNYAGLKKMSVKAAEYTKENFHPAKAGNEFFNILNELI